MSNDRKSLAELTHALGDAPTALQIAKSLRALGQIDAKSAGLKPLKLHVVSSFTFDPLVKPLVARGCCDGFALDVWNAPFGQFTQELINPAGTLTTGRPDAVLIAVRLQDVCADLYERFNALSASDVNGVVERWKTEFAQAVESFRARSGARILCTNYETPAYPALGPADRKASPSQLQTVGELNAWLAEFAGRAGDFHVVDVDALAARCGRDAWTDPKLWYWARVPVADRFHWAYAGEITRLLRITYGKSRKVLALDCDNTLWGGVLGDVGRDGIQLGHDYPGSAYVALQKRALELMNRGVVLVVASKNERANVLDVFENHPEMVLRPQHISYFAVDWNPKPQNLKAAAEILNLGIDSFVFLDDHPVECAMMRELLPDVLTVQLPAEPAEFERALARLDVFDQLAVSAEDRQRGEMYRQEATRAALKSQATDLESFYRGLEMRAIIAVNDESGLARAAQLTQRTNQFNMTTVRRTESEMLAVMRAPHTDVVTIRLVDRCGDNGVVGLAVVEKDGERCNIETFLMSCRVLGRTVEQAFLAWIGQRALRGGARRLEAQYRPTKKNNPFRDFYRSWGMEQSETDADGNETWRFELQPEASSLKLPDWIAIETAGGEWESA